MSTPPRKPVVIESNRYEQARQKLREDSIVDQMAEEIAIEMKSPENRSAFINSDNRPTFNFMTIANREYARRGGKRIAHIGGVAEVIIEKVLQFEKDHQEDYDA